MSSATGTHGVFRLRDFRLLVTGEGISLLGDQFFLIALPWLVLQLTGSPLTLGVVLGLQGIPRALFMLVGGAVTDRFSPRAVMMAANVVRLAIVGLLAAFTLAGSVQVWMLYAFALILGIADGFFFPAQNAIVPQIAGRDQLQTANAVVQGLEQVAQFVAPAGAGVLIAALDHGHALTGVGVALAIDAGTFLVSLVMAWLLSVRHYGAEAGDEASVLASIRAGLAYMWHDPTLRMLFLLIVAVNFLVIGPILVGVPVIAARRLGGARAYGIAMSAFGGGSLAGIALAGALPRPAPRITGPLLLATCSLFSIALAVLGFAHSLVGVAAPLAVMGGGAGYLVVFFFTWLQGRTPEAMMGRMMGLIMFASVGLVPVSQALAGALIRVSMPLVFVGAAALLAVILTRAALTPALMRMGLEMAAEQGRPQ